MTWRLIVGLLMLAAPLWIVLSSGVWHLWHVAYISDAGTRRRRLVVFGVGWLVVSAWTAGGILLVIL
ncbi:MAG TPA: hypothetical protein VMW24_23365 [Sedimentisphaerales bacterium]|nr:hypothetical protein [Sedimentisphaerales bacterium]